jgi:hypothetical protein
MAVLIAFLLGENSPFVGGPFHVADTVDRKPLITPFLVPILIRAVEIHILF